ncbi:Putative elongation factor TypA-like svr3, chloroplastic [Pleodorina starrii]|uniref:Elongation factor Tu, chloroplastic n=1 Tax=Pleodorina starrii TaxID=330485 RepID=A0A9W6F7U9_9CHLO|nr:Putative elongation factor TypA-like svr3 [Pleodorina starrii]GLC58921.1 Putative elongation factor TypA-like svr3, chloroplastic [Pleodorina starrii]GLC65082.1 Putative elongation factor TypA-like svr3 [Pleodorina starrii]
MQTLHAKMAQQQAGRSVRTKGMVRLDAQLTAPNVVGSSTAAASVAPRSGPAPRLATAVLPSRPQTNVVCRTATVDAPPASGASGGSSVREDIRNIAIIAHVDHGKTTLVDAMLKQSKVFRDNQNTAERIMDSNDLERERGITILAKNTAVRYRGIKVNIIDTPGHADFGGEVERVINMCDGVLLLVDSVEGPMPQTRFVLRKALELNKRVVVVVNKIDRPAARPEWVIDSTFELFMDLGASDELCEFPVVYASGVNGIAGMQADGLAADLEPLFETIVKEIRPPTVAPEAPLQMLCANIDYDEHKGRIAIGRVTGGTIRRGQTVSICSSLEPGKVRPAKIAELFVYDNFSRVPVDEVTAGDICALSGIADIKIGETITQREAPVPLPTIQVEDPTVSMTFKVNTSPFAGKEGKFVTSRNLKDRLDRELERNLALRVDPGETSDSFIVSGRGTLHLGILIENMRREGYEFEIGPPKVITREVEGKTCEPYEEAIVDVPENYVGAVVELFAQRKGEMVDLIPSIQGASRVKFRIATRGLLGLKNALLTATRGLGVMNTLFLEYAPVAGEILMRENGSLVAHETGQVTSYALESAQERGQMFVRPGDQVYEGQCVGVHAKAGDLKVNVCKTKQLTNMRAASKEIKVGLDEPRTMGLDDALEYINDDEQVEVTPKSVRIRKDPSAVNKGRKGK